MSPSLSGEMRREEARYAFVPSLFVIATWKVEGNPGYNICGKRVFCLSRSKPASECDMFVHVSKSFENAHKLIMRLLRLEGLD